MYTLVPTVLRFGRFRFVIYPQDHGPAHVHVMAAGAKAKFNIRTGRCLAAFGFTRKTLKRLSEVVKRHQDLLLEAWNEYEGQ